MEPILGRREFVGMSVAFVSSLKAAQPQAKFPAQPRERLAVSIIRFAR
jgi:hypothetical protein